MPRYYFHFYDEFETRDPVGVELPGMEMASIVTAHELRQLMRLELQHGRRAAMSDRIDIADEGGRVLGTVCLADVV